jgi:hypothetical protein
VSKQPLPDAIVESLKKRLMSIMSCISEDEWAAGWIIDLEYDLWELVTTGQSQFTGTPESIAEMRALSEVLDGWSDGDGFVPMAEWLPRYERWHDERERERNLRAYRIATSKWRFKPKSKSILDFWHEIVLETDKYTSVERGDDEAELRRKVEAHNAALEGGAA